MLNSKNKSKTNSSRKRTINKRMENLNENKSIKILTHSAIPNKISIYQKAMFFRTNPSNSVSQTQNYYKRIWHNSPNNIPVHIFLYFTKKKTIARCGIYAIRLLLGRKFENKLVQKERALFVFPLNLHVCTQNEIA